MKNIECGCLYINIKNLNLQKELWTKHKLDCIFIDGIIEQYNTAGK